MRLQRIWVLPALLVLLAVSPAWARTWTDDTGQFSVEAELVEVKDGKAWLRKSDGKVIAVPLAKLSQSDRDFLASAREGLARSSPAELKEAKALAIRAGEVQLSAQLGETAFELKADRSPVTAVDRRCEDLIREGLRALRGQRSIDLREQPLCRFRGR